MENLVFNIILLHIGETFDDRKESFKEKHPVLFKCFESVKKEFKDDNIIVFYSYEEIFEKFPEIKEAIDKKYSKLFYDKSIQESFKTDLIRILLTKYYENMLYLDADIYINKGFKAKLLKIARKESALFFVIYKGLGSFYSKEPFEKINVFLKLFEKDGNYNGDENGMQRCNFKDLEEVSFKYRFDYFSLHHVYCSTDRGKFKNIFIIPDNYNLDIYEMFHIIHKFKECGYFIQNKNKIIICKSYEGYVYQIDISKEITIDDYLKEVEAFDSPKIKLNNL